MGAVWGGGGGGGAAEGGRAAEERLLWRDETPRRGRSHLRNEPERQGKTFKTGSELVQEYF